MTIRVVAWLVVLAIGWGVVKGISAFSSPWTVPVSPIMAVLPDQPDGCGKDCK